ncbi:Hsp33 family molecular chaperone HslO [Vitiosangium sp. GDMCC 1.1324]|uniref:Hsp33 family molecular chaperone HslO n=1 Tax=Vitiosangium sp. (strain GDMCC 1.1324) TaxID=2138576 RepID=UPI000D34DBFD|nr:Hsp33 family molecular chaperone HslO [Vitiosangium sp. GDMCC 1.1324]PTL76397.1 Hsp33 family molecular chaperone HslO [Vitiosangium sp. GDMCC 1.1324]
MADELVSGLLKETDLRVVLVTASELARKARELHRSATASASLMAQGLTAGALLSSLQKSDSRVNLQLECDGPLRGLFVDGDTSGVLRGYAKNPLVSHVGSEGEYHWRPALGNKGYLSVLRDLGSGEYYRSAVELESFDLAKDLERYFATSDQLPTRVFLSVQPVNANGTTEPLGLVAGMLLQPLPNGDRDAFRALGDRLAKDFEPTVRAHAGQGAGALLKALVPQPDLEVMSRYPVSFTCSCSKDRVKRALVSMGREELEDILAKEGQAEADCHFCTTHYVVSGDEIREILAEMAQATS